MVVDTVVATMEWVDSSVSVAGCKPSVDLAATALLDVVLLAATAPLGVVLLAATVPLDAPPAVLSSPLDAPTTVLPAPVARRPWGSTPG